MQLQRVAIIAIVLALALPAPSTVRAGLWDNVGTAMGNLVENYNNNMEATGDHVIEAVKNKDVHAAVIGYNADMETMGQGVINDSKALGAALKEIVAYIPNAIKAVWDKIVDFLVSLREKFCYPGHTPPADPPAEEPVAEEPAVEEPAEEEIVATEEVEVAEEAATSDEVIADLAEVKASSTSNHFLSTFASSNDHRLQLDTYLAYRTQLDEMTALIENLDGEAREETVRKIQFLLHESSEMERILEEAVASAVDSGQADDALLAELAQRATNETGATRTALRPLLKTTVRAINGHYVGSADTMPEHIQALKNSVDTDN